MKKRLTALAVLVIAGLGAWLYRQFSRAGEELPPKPRTVEQVMRAVGPAAEKRLRPAFQKAAVPFPPRQVTLLAFKRERRMELHAPDRQGRMRLVCAWPILGASGEAGPKLREGDRQVPEGFYGIQLLNPNSRFHLSLRVNYPNRFDIARAREEGRDMSNLGSDIMIHGGSSSVGCLAMGDAVAEEIFVLVARMGLENITLIIAPWDFRAGAPGARPEAGWPEWTPALHDQLRQAIAAYPVTPTP